MEYKQMEIFKQLNNNNSKCAVKKNILGPLHSRKDKRDTMKFCLPQTYSKHAYVRYFFQFLYTQGPQVTVKNDLLYFF